MHPFAKIMKFNFITFSWSSLKMFVYFLICCKIQIKKKSYFIMIEVKMQIVFDNNIFSETPYAALTEICLF